MNFAIVIELVALALVIGGAFIGFPPTMALAFAEGVDAPNRIDEQGAIRARNRGLLIFLLGVALGAAGVWLA